MFIVSNIQTCMSARKRRFIGAEEGQTVPLCPDKTSSRFGPRKFDAMAEKSRKRLGARVGTVDGADSQSDQEFPLCLQSNLVGVVRPFSASTSEDERVPTRRSYKIPSVHGLSNLERTNMKILARSRPPTTRGPFSEERNRRRCPFTRSISRESYQTDREAS